MQDRFFSASDGRERGVDPRTDASQDLRFLVVALAELIDRAVPDGRNKEIALTSLEDVQMRANRGIFAPDALK